MWWWPVTTRVDYLIAALTLLRDRLAPVVDELLAGQASQAGLTELAGELDVIAANLRHAAVDAPRVVDGDQVSPTHNRNSSPAVKLTAER